MAAPLVFAIVQQLNMLCHRSKCLGLDKNWYPPAISLISMPKASPSLFSILNIIHSITDNIGIMLNPKSILQTIFLISAAETVAVMQKSRIQLRKVLFKFIFYLSLKAILLLQLIMMIYQYPLFVDADMHTNDQLPNQLTILQTYIKKTIFPKAAPCITPKPIEIFI